MCVRACVCVCVRMCMCVCVLGGGYVHVHNHTLHIPTTEQLFPGPPNEVPPAPLVPLALSRQPHLYHLQTLWRCRIVLKLPRL